MLKCEFFLVASKHNSLEWIFEGEKRTLRTFLEIFFVSKFDLNESSKRVGRIGGKRREKKG